MMFRRWIRRRSGRGSGLAVAAALIAATAADASHSTPPPPPPPGHGHVMVRLVRPRGESGSLPDGQVPLHPVELHRAGAGPGEAWVKLPLLRPEFAARELEGGQVWVAAAAVKVGEFDRIRIGSGEGSQVPLALRVSEGQWIMVTLEAGLQPPGRGSPVRVELKGARILGPTSLAPRPLLAALPGGTGD